jgi:triosephosphate isomerase (TIM)
MNLPPAGVGPYFDGLTGVDVAEEVVLAVAPPFPFLAAVSEEVRRRQLDVEVGGQNCSDRASGALTGEVSAGMLKSVGASFVIVGHSERRGLFGERDELVRKKLEAVVESGLQPVLCIGEPLEIREGGDIEAYLRKQLDAALSGWTAAGLVVAYEPIWAIGTGRNASGAMVAETGSFLREAIDRLASGEVPLLYGGSVTDENVGELVEEGRVDGFLVGGASLDAGRFGRIYAASRRA